MFFNPALTAALDQISDRAADVRRAFSPGGMPDHDDVATTRNVSDFTLDPLSVSVAPGMYFVARIDGSQAAYTRNGSFVLRGGRLETSDGEPICGFDAPRGRLHGLRVDAIDDALSRVRDPRIEPDGRLVYQRITIDPRSGAGESQRVVVGRVALARFPAGTRLVRSAEGALVAPAGVAPELGNAGDPGFPRLAPMHRERSGIDLDESLARLKDAYLTFDALQAAETAKGHLGKTAMDLVK